MDNDAQLQNIETRLQRLEADSISMHDRMGKVEDKASAAWKTINEVNTKVDKIEEKVNSIDQRMNSFEGDIKGLKVSQAQNSKDLKWIKWLVIFSACISVAFFIYIWRHDADLAKSILALGSTVATAI